LRLLNLDILKLVSQQEIPLKRAGTLVVLKRQIDFFISDVRVRGVRS